MLSLALLVCALTFCSAHFFSATGDMRRMVELEKEIVEVLKEHKEQLESSLETIRNYGDEMRDMYSREGCWPLAESACSDDSVLVERIIGNPIYSYQTLKRLFVYFKKVEETLKAVDVKKTLGVLRRVRHRHGGLPTEEDLQNAARAINRLQEMYNIDVKDFANGNILGVQTTAELSVKDTYYLGRFAASSDNPVVALRWLETAAIQAAAESGMADNRTVSVVVKGTMKPQIEQVIKQVKRRLPPHQKASTDNGDEFEDYEFRLGRIPPKTHDPKKYETEDDRINYRALCRGRQLLPERERSMLMCYYSDVNRHPMYLVGPLKVEVVHRDPHGIIMFHDVISDKEADTLISLAEPKMAQASVGAAKVVSDLRVSRNAWLEAEESDVVDKLSRRIDSITGYQTTRKYDRFGEGKPDEYEKLQIAHYGIGGHYGTHQDPMYLYKEPDYLAKLGEKQEYVTGDRMATFMLYLSDVAHGGYTAFPRLGVKVQPKKGSAVFWHNIKRSGRSDMAMLHGGCPVLLGSKWVANKWVREVANVFHRPCINDIDT